MSLMNNEVRRREDRPDVKTFSQQSECIVLATTSQSLGRDFARWCLCCRLTTPEWCADLRTSQKVGHPTGRKCGTPKAQTSTVLRRRPSVRIKWCELRRGRHVPSSRFNSVCGRLRTGERADVAGDKFHYSASSRSITPRSAPCTRPWRHQAGTRHTDEWHSRVLQRFSHAEAVTSPIVSPPSLILLNYLQRKAHIICQCSHSFATA